MNRILKKRDRRSFLRDSAFAAGGIVGIGGIGGTVARPRAMAVALESQQAAGRRAATSTSLSRQFAQWVVGLRYEDLPAAVVDRAKGLTLQNLASALLGSQMPAGQQAVKFVTDEEAGVRNGATIMVSGAQGDQGRRRLRQLGDDAGRRQVGYLPHAHPSRHDHHPGGARRRGDRGRVGKGLHHRRRGRLRGHGADGGRLDSDGDGARLPREPGVRHLRRRDRRRRRSCTSPRTR